MATVFTSGPMEVFTKATGTRIKFQVTVNTIGTMVGYTKVTGLIITCMVKVSINGPTAENTNGDGT